MTIIPFPQKISWLEAIKKAKMPTNKQLDKILIENGKEREELSKQSYFPAWSSTVLVKPEKDGAFKKGEDVEDSYNAGGKHMVFLAKDIPKVAFGKKGVFLVVEPKEVEEKGAKLIVHPKEIIVKENGLQETGWGKLDRETGLPVKVSEEELKKMPEDQKRYIYLNDEAGVRPLLRYGDDFDVRRDVYAGGRFDYRFGVGVVEPSQTQAKANKPSKMLNSEEQEEVQRQEQARQIREEYNRIYGFDKRMKA